MARSTPISFLKENKPAIALAIICFLAFAINLYFLSQFSLVLGHDGAYYLSRLEQFKNKQLTDSIISTPPVFFALAAIATSFFEANFSINLVSAIFLCLLGISVFLLARFLLKDNWLAIATTMIVLFSRQEIILITELKKNLAGLFFVPLFFYFFFKASKQKKFLLAAIITLLFGFLTHKTVIGIIALVLLAFVPLQFAFERKQTRETKNFVLLFLLALLAFSIVLLFNEKTANSIFSETQNWLNETRDKKADIDLSGFALLFPAAIIGFFLCLLRAKKEELFLASWLLVGLWASFPFVSGSESWRFVLLLILPLSFLSGYLLKEIKTSHGKKAALLAFAILLFFSLFFFAKEIIETKPIFSQQDYNALLEINSVLDSQKPCVVFAAGTSYYWSEFLIKNCETKTIALQEILQKAKEFSLAGKQSFVLIDKDKNEQKMFDKNYSFFAESGNRVLLKPRTDINYLVAAPVETAQGYPSAKLSNPFVLLFFPTELPLLLNAPFALFLRIFFGIPVSFAIFGFALAFLQKLLGEKQ